MWFNRKPPKQIPCFFCNIPIDLDDAFELKYKAENGENTVHMCPMCAGMIGDMSTALRELDG